MSLKISVGTICFNNPEELQRTCVSVDSQIRNPDEHLIIDGSTDNRIKTWLETTPQPGYRRWICEPDEGLSDAFNKAITFSTGELIHLLNSGDYYYDEQAIKLTEEAFLEDPQLKWTNGQYLQFRGNRWVISGKPFDKDKLYRGMRQVAHPTMFVKRELYEKYGLFDKNKKIAMDYDFQIRIRNEKNKFIPYPVACFEPGGASHVHFKKGLRETADSYRKYIGKSFRQKLWFFRIILLNRLMETKAGRLVFRLKNKGRIKE